MTTTNNNTAPHKKTWEKPVILLLAEGYVNSGNSLSVHEGTLIPVGPTPGGRKVGTHGGGDYYFDVWQS